MKQEKLLSSKDFIICLIIGFAFYLLNQFSLFKNDDYLYAFISGTDSPVTSLKDAILSQYYDYFHAGRNGRFIIHTIVQYFCGVLGFHSFQICNSIVFTLLCIGVIMLLRLEFNEKIKYNVILLFMLLFFLSGIALTSLANIAEAINYLWTACAIIFFLLIYYKHHKEQKRHSFLYYIFIFIFALITGSLQESFSFGLAAAFFFYYCFNFKFLQKSELWIIGGFLFGTCIVLFSPANFYRYNENYYSIASYLLGCGIRAFQLLSNAIMLDILLFITIISFLFNKGKAKNYIQNNIIWILTILFNSLFVIMIIYMDKRQLTCINLFSIILIIKWIYTYYPIQLNRYNNHITIVLISILIALYIPIYKYNHNLSKAHQILINNATSSTDGTAEATEYSLFCITQNNWITNNFTRKRLYNNWENHALSRYITKAKNENYITAVLPAPKESIINTCNDSYKIKEHVYRNKSDYWYILKLPTDTNINSYKISTLSKPAFSIRKKITDIFFSKDNDNLANLSEHSYANWYNYFIDKGYYYIIIYDYKEPMIVDINIIKNN